MNYAYLVPIILVLVVKVVIKQGYTLIIVQYYKHAHQFVVQDIIQVLLVVYNAM